MLTAASSAVYQNVGAIIAIVAAVVAGIAAVRKFGPERNALFITTAEGAATIQDNLIQTLQREVDRERARGQALGLEVERLAAENVKLREANESLKRRRGMREGDRGGK